MDDVDEFMDQVLSQEEQQQQPQCHAAVAAPRAAPPVPGFDNNQSSMMASMQHQQQQQHPLYQQQHQQQYQQQQQQPQQQHHHHHQYHDVFANTTAPMQQQHMQHQHNMAPVPPMAADTHARMAQAALIAQQHQQQQQQLRQQQQHSMAPPAARVYVAPSVAAAASSMPPPPFVPPPAASPAEASATSTSASTSSNTSSVHTTPASDDSYNDVIARMVLRVAIADESPRRPQVNGSGGSGSGAGGGHPTGPLTAAELSELSLLCTRQEQQASGSKINSTTGGFASVEAEQLASLVELLDKHMNMASNINLIQQAVDVIQANEDAPTKASAVFTHWLKNNLPHEMTVLRLGLEAASILLCMAATRGVDRRVVHEDAIGAAISLYRSHVGKHLIPALNQTGHYLKKSGKSSSGKSKGGPSSPSSAVSSPPLAKRRRRSAGVPAAGGDENVAKHLKKLYPHLLGTQHLQMILMDRLENVVCHVPLEDQQVVILTSGSLPVLELEGNSASSSVSSISKNLSQRNGGNGSTSSSLLSAASLGQQLQLAGIRIVTASFARYPGLRETILDDVFPILLRLPSRGKYLRCFPVRYASTACPQTLANLNARLLGPLLPNLNLVASASTRNGQANGNAQQQHYIQMFTYFLISLIQACVTRPTYEVEGAKSNDQEEEQEEEEQVDSTNRQLVSGLSSCQTMADSFVHSLLKRCATPRTKGATSAATEFRPVLQNLVEDLLLVLIIPEYPAAEMLLEAICKRLAVDLHRVTQLPMKKNGGLASPAAGAAHGVAEATYLTTAFDILGKICSVQARILAVHRDRPIGMNVNRDGSEAAAALAAMGQNGDEDGGQEFVMKCYCGKKTKDSFIVECDDCQFWSHGNCVGIESTNVNEDWACDACRLGRIVRRERRKYPSSTSAAAAAAGSNGNIDDDNDGPVNAFVDDAYAMRQSFLSSLAHRKGVPDLEPAVQFHVARWADELEEKVLSLSSGNGAPSRGMVEELLVNWGEEAKQPTGEPLTEEGSNRVILALLAKTSPLFKTFRKQLSFIIMLMSNESMPSLRKLSVKTIEKTAEGDPQLILLPIITKAVSRRLTDQSISVREASVSLVGSHVVKFPAVAKAFHSSLLQCLTDVGVSVRKRAVRIFQDILTLNPRYKGRAEVCDRMLQRAADPKEEDSLRDLIHDVFTKLWLQDGDAIIAGTGGGLGPSPPSSPATPANSELLSNGAANGNGAVAVGQNLVTPTPARVKSRSKRTVAPMKRVDLAAAQMMEVVRSGGTSEHLETLLKQLLAASANSDKGRKQEERLQRQELAKKHCGQIVNSLFELFVKIEEQRSTRGARIGPDLAATLQTISVFAEVSSGSVIGHLDTILPYLKAANKVSFEDETRIVCAGCNIVSLLAPVFDHDDLVRLSRSSIGKDLTAITYKFGTSALSSSIRAFSALAHHSEASEDCIFSDKLLEVAKSFYKYLVKNQETEDFSSDEVTKKVRANVWRALTVLGFVCRYFDKRHNAADWEDEIEGLNEALPDSKEITWSNITVACYRLFSNYLEKRDAPTKCAALKALGGIFMAEPRLMFELEQVGLVDSVIAESADISLQIEALTCFQTILRTEEKRIDGGYAKAKMDRDTTVTVEKRISGDQDEDSNLFGGVLTNHSERLFVMTQSPNKTVRFAALDLLGVLLRQGLVNPNEAIPYLFALQGDVDHTAIRSMALHMLMREGEKRPDSLRQRVCLGVKKAYQFQKSVYHSRETVSALVPTSHGEGEVCIFDSIFKDCIASIRKQRHGLFKNLLSLFELGDLRDESTSSSKKKKARGNIDLALLSFAAQILASLSYSTLDNPLYIIHYITSMVTLQGEQILDRMADVLRTVGLSSEDCLDDSNSGEDALERAANARFPSRTQEAQDLNSAHFDLEEFTYLCRAGAAMALLLRLKTYLRRAYNVSETRCLEYDPTEKERISDKGISKAELSKPFNAAVAPGLLHDRADKDALIRQYAEFRRLTRDDMAIVAKATEDSMDLDEEKKDEEEIEVPEEEQPMPEPAPESEAVAGQKRTRRSSRSG